MISLDSIEQKRMNWILNINKWIEFIRILNKKFNRKRFEVFKKEETSMLNFLNQLEENRLKKELADIAMALNLEAQKAKNDLNDFLK